MCVWIFLEWRDLIFPAAELSQGHPSGRKAQFSGVLLLHCCLPPNPSSEEWWYLFSPSPQIHPKFSHLNCYWEYHASIFRDVEFSSVGVHMRVIATSLWAFLNRSSSMNCFSWKLLLRERERESSSLCFYSEKQQLYRERQCLIERAPCWF
jgi:hypothetical protein